MNTYRQDLDFLRQHSDVIELRSDDDSRLSLVPAWQGRVMTSSASADGRSYGWLNYELIETGIQPEEQRQGLERHIYAFGGEERFWIGPEGGQFSSFFMPGQAFEFESWLVPSFIDTDPWELIAHSETRAVFRHQEKVTNWSGHHWDLRIRREVALLTLEEALETSPPATVTGVSYDSINTITNGGAQAWTESTGMPSIWILGMMKHGPETTVVIPFKTLGEDLGKVVTDDYFGKVPADRLKVDESAGVLFFSADGEFRSKIGISPQRSKGVAGSWDSLNGVLTIVQYNQPSPANTRYVNSQWAQQDNPFEGDAINSYNDGPVDGGQLGPFYEIETSSPALNLAPGEHYTHSHRTTHLEGARNDLDTIAIEVLGVSLATIESSLQ